MNVEFHYYLTKYIALEAGFDADEAEIIAYSNQLVDDNIYPLKIDLPDGESYENFVSHTPDSKNPEKFLIRRYILFHFMPGNPTNSKVFRKDGKMHLLMTTADSAHASEIFFDTTKSENLYSLGIASHMLADSIAHQNFVGTLEEMNSMNGVWETMTPAIGHVLAGDKPDIPNLEWKDPRLIDENAIIHNPDRIILAAKKLYSNYILITSAESNWNKVKKNIHAIISDTIREDELDKVNEQSKNRITKYKELLSEFDAESDYHPHTWIKEALPNFDSKNLEKGLSVSENYSKTNWFRFQEAIKQYQKIASEKIRPIINQLELKGW
jgi:hypothetical protein